MSSLRHIVADSDNRVGERNQAAGPLERVLQRAVHAPTDGDGGEVAAARIQQTHRNRRGVAVGKICRPADELGQSGIHTQSLCGIAAHHGLQAARTVKDVIGDIGHPGAIEPVIDKALAGDCVILERRVDVNRVLLLRILCPGRQRGAVARQIADVAVAIVVVEIQLYVRADEIVGRYVGRISGIVAYEHVVEEVHRHAAGAVVAIHGTGRSGTVHHHRVVVEAGLGGGHIDTIGDSRGIEKYFVVGKESRTAAVLIEVAGIDAVAGRHSRCGKNAVLRHLIGRAAGHLQAVERGCSGRARNDRIAVQRVEIGIGHLVAIIGAAHNVTVEIHIRHGAGTAKTVGEESVIGTLYKVVLNTDMLRTDIKQRNAVMGVGL